MGFAVPNDWRPMFSGSTGGEVGVARRDRRSTANELPVGAAAGPQRIVVGEQAFVDMWNHMDGQARYDR
jgi:hypothetical protein